MKYWIARDKDGCLFFYKEEPFKDFNMWHISIPDTFCEPIDPNLFPEVTWENSPQEVELKLINQ